MISFITGFHASTFVYLCFSPKIKFLYCLLSSLFTWGAPLMGTEVKIIWNLSLQIIRKCVSITLSDYRSMAWHAWVCLSLGLQCELAWIYLCLSRLINNWSWEKKCAYTENIFFGHFTEVGTCFTQRQINW